MMDIEVDPQLFVTCRLCLEETGLYQICPKLQHDIKYCFDIDVQTFDGLPQLICKKCKTILNDHYQIKTLFVEKQQSLKLKVQQKSDETVTCQLEQIVRTSQTTENQNNTHTKNRLERKSSVFSTASTTSDVRINKREVDKPLPWKDHYNRYYVCRLCQKRYKKKYTINMHIRNHSERFKYGKILRNKCTIKLNKIDDYPNLTGTSDAVVYSHDKILFEEGKAYYYVLYVLKNSVSAPNRDDGGSDCSLGSEEKSSSKRILTVSSDEEVMTLKSRKRFRLLSKSSNETVAIEGDNRNFPSDEDGKLELDTDFKQKEINHTETIDIDDTSSEDFEQHSKVDENEAINTKDTILPMQHISSACKKRYLKKLDSEYDTLKEKTDKESATSEPLLKHKILSIGVKVINSKKGFECTGLLRFMEHKNLDMVWISNDSINDPKVTNYVRIMPKLRADHSVKNLGWKNILESVPEKLSNDQSEDNIFGNVIESNTNIKPLLNNPKSHCQLLEKGYEKNDTDRAVLYLNSNMEANAKNKLLNASPVLNPKQLPKNIKIKQTVNGHNVNINQNTQNTDNDKSFFVNVDTSESETSLPIITSTTSLAAIDTEDKKKQRDVTSKLESAPKPKQTARIKVKPASELMSEKALNNFSQQQFSGMWSANENQNILKFQNPIMSQSQNDHQPTVPLQIVRPPILSQQNVGDTAKLADSSCVILDTTDLPNKKTYSPFKYFKDLLCIHGMVLLDSNESLSQDFNCLMKFKLVFKQDISVQIITLCISIFCNENRFCLNIKDNNQQNIDINKMSANWQWEILKACKGDRVNRVLLNAEKQGAAVYSYTKRFIFLLKSIKMISE